MINNSLIFLDRLDHKSSFTAEHLNAVPSATTSTASTIIMITTNDGKPLGVILYSYLSNFFFFLN